MHDFDRGALLVLLVSVGVTLFSTLACADDTAPYAEKLRPQFHFTAARGWLNDPNGLVFFDGKYHLFFQHNPTGTRAGNLHWGHAVSTDLLHWKQMDEAIAPDQAGDIWSGSAVVDWNNTSGFGSAGGPPPIIAAYTAARDPFAQHIVYSTDGGQTFTRFSGNPVLPFIHAKNRDPKIIWHEPSKQWILALYIDRPCEFGLFSSPDLKKWTPIQSVTLEGDNECPDFFPLNLDGDASKQKWVFTAASGRYMVGSFDGKSFTPETDVLDSEHGPNFYAAQTYSDIPASDGRRIQIGWMRDGKYPDMPFNQQMSIPAELTLRSTPRGPRLFRWPVREIEWLYHGQARIWQDRTIVPLQDLLDGVSGELFDITADVDPGDASLITLKIRGQSVAWRPEGPLGGAINAFGRRVYVPRIGGRIKLRAIVDRTSIEIFANDGAIVLSGCYLPADGQPPLSLIATGGDARLISFTVQPLKSALPQADAAQARGISE